MHRTLALALFATLATAPLVARTPPAFRTPYRLGANLPPYGFAVGDVHSDGKVDVIVSHATQLRLFAGDGTGQVSAGAAIATATAGPTLAAGDLDHDGRVDVVAVGSNGILETFLGSPAGLATAGTTATVTATAWSARLADFDGDGNLDVVAGFTTGMARWLKGNGSGGFGPSTPIAALAASTLAVGDVDQDGDVDAVGIDHVNNLRIALGDGAGGFTSGGTLVLQSNKIPQRLLLQDLEGDGDLDAISLHANSGGHRIIAVRNDGGAFTVVGGQEFTIPWHFTQTFPIWDIAGRDVNGDGSLDLLACGVEQFLLAGNGQGAFAPIVDVPIGGSVSFCGFIDMNGDSQPDVVAVPQLGDVAVALADPTNLLGVYGGKVVNGLVPPIPEDGTESQAFDVDQDGDMDLVYAGSMKLYAQRNDGSGNFAPAVVYSLPGDTPRQLTHGDLDGDGFEDLAMARFVSASPKQGLLTMRSAPGGLLPAVIAYVWSSGSNGDASRGIAIGDLDADGDIDVVESVLSSATHVSDIRPLLNDGTGALTSAPPLSAGTNGTAKNTVAIADVDQNGTADLIAGNVPAGTAIESTPGRVTIWKANPPLTFGPPAHFGGGRDPSDVQWTDVDGDGNEDLLWANNAASPVSYPFGISYCRGDGTGAFGPPLDLAPQASTRTVACEDVDGDGVSDVIGVASGYGALILHRGDGTGGFGAKENYATSNSSGGGLLRFADVTGDGTPELIVNAFTILDRNPAAACAGSIATYGAGCAGSGGYVPHLEAHGCPVSGGILELDASLAKGGSSGVIFLGFAPAALPMGFGCKLFVAPPLIPLSIATTAGGNGVGTFAFRTVLPSALPALTLHAQLFVSDVGVPAHYAASNGLALTFP